MIVKKQIRTSWKNKNEDYLRFQKNFESNHILFDFFSRFVILRKLAYLQKKLLKKFIWNLWSLNKPASHHFFSLWESFNFLKVGSWNKNLKKSYFFFLFVSSWFESSDLQFSKKNLLKRFSTLSTVKFSKTKAQSSLWSSESKRLLFVFIE